MKAAIRLGIVGTGGMAATMARTVARTPGIDVVAVASSDPQRAARFAQALGVPHSYASATALAAEADVDAIYIANRPKDHFAAAEAALSAGKPTLVEKPFATSREGGEALVALARDKGVRLTENLWCLCLPAYLELATRLRSGDYGDAVHLAFDFGYPLDRMANRSQLDPIDGGVLRDRAVCGVSLALILLGPVQEMRSAVQYDTEGVDMVAAIVLTHTGGAISQLSFVNALMSNVATLACTRGMLRLDSPSVGAESVSAQHMSPIAYAYALDPQSTKLRLMDRLKSIPQLRQLNRRRSAPRGIAIPYGANPYQPVLQHFSDLVRTGRRESDLIPLSLSLEALRLIVAARNADRSPLAGDAG